MTHLANLQRDQFHLRFTDLERSVFGATYAKGRNINCQARAPVGDDYNTVLIASASVTNAAGNWSGVGCFIAPPFTDATPYRVKGYISSAATELFAFAGFGPATPVTGSNFLTEVVSFPIKDGKFDEIIKLPYIDEADPDYGLPICFGLAVGEASAAETDAVLSVQKLSVASPTYASTVS